MKFKMVFILLFSLIPLFAQNTDAYKRVGELLDNRQTEEAKSILLKMLDAHKNQPDTYYYLGVCALMDNDHEVAIERLKQAVRLDGRNYRYYERLGDAYGLKAQNGGILSAIWVVGDMREAWEKAVELKPDLVSARQRLFSYYIEAPGIAGGDRDKALRLAQEVSALDTLAGHLLMARFYQKQDALKKAEAELQKAAQLAPDNGNLMNQLGYFYLRQGEARKAKTWFKKYIRLEPENANAYDSMGDCYAKSAANDSALAMFEKALQLNPKFEASLYKKALTLKKLNRQAEMKTAAQTYKRIFPKGRYADEMDELLDD